MGISKSTLLLAVALITFSSTSANNQEQNNKGKIEGNIVDQRTGSPLPGTNVYLVDRFGGAIADDSGHFVIRGLEPGTYGLRISHLGYESLEYDSVAVSHNEPAQITVALIEKAYNIKGITVTPGYFSIMGKEATASQSLTRQELETNPQTGEDLFRAVNRLPGVAAEDFTSRFIVRGGEYEEVLVTLDGVQLYEPFHLKEFKGGMFGAVDASAIESIELKTGGFTAEHGDRASGVFNITSHRPPTGQRKVSAAVSFMNARFMTEGTFANNKGSWLVSGRRGYLDVLLKIAGEGEKLRPTYYDMIGKVQYQLGDNHILSGHVFHAGDRFKVIDNDDNDADTIITSYDNSYLWFNLQSQFHPRVMAHTILSANEVKHDRFGFALWRWQQVEDAQVSDAQTFNVFNAKSDWELEIADWNLLKAGFDARSLRAEYDYFGTDHIYYVLDDGTYELERIDTVQSFLEPSGNQVGAYLSNRLQVADPVTFEVGVRYDRHSYTGDEKVSPRVNVALQTGEYTTLRAGWGHFYQAQRIDELMVGDDLTDFYPAERAEHRTVGLEHDFGTGVRMRLEAYYKKYTDLRPEGRNTFDGLHAFPEFEDDRIIVYRDESVAQGLEVFLKREKGSKFTWWASYAYAKIEDKINHVWYRNISGPDGMDIVYNDTYPNPFDQRHTVYLDLSYRPSVKWQFNLAWHYHSGWPYTGVEVRSAVIDDETVYWLNQGELLAERYPAYTRLDLRVNRYFDFWGGRLTAFLEVINVLGRENVRGYEYDLVGSGGTVWVDQNVESAFPRLPILGVTYSLNM